MKYLNPDIEKPITLDPVGSWLEEKHRWDRKSVWAINAAIGAQRPLLICGEPGLGKSQIARAAAQLMNRPLMTYVVHGRSEASDLHYQYDAVARLAEAQLLARDGNKGDLERLKDLSRFVSPGPLWWAIHWESATEFSGGAGAVTPPIHREAHPRNGCVLLVDEIDKADVEFANALLEVTANLRFSIPLLGNKVIEGKGQPPPLIVFTTNEEREMPAPFLRRCLVLSLSLPEDEVEFVIERGRDHFGTSIADEVYVEAAKQWKSDRDKSISKHQYEPGPSEYLDILRALKELYPGDGAKQMEALNEIASFSLKKTGKD